MGFAERELHPERSPRDLYGSEIRRHRELAGKMTLTRLAEILNFSKAHLSRIECGESPPPPGLSEKLDIAFGTDGLFVRLYPHAREDHFPNRYRRYMQLATQAAKRASYTKTVPGLLQTLAVAEAILRAGNPQAFDDEIEHKVTARLKLQERLWGLTPPSYWFILDESALRRMLPDAEDNREQLQLLLKASSLRHVTLQIMPFSAGFHTEFEGSLHLLTLPSGKVVAYEESSRSGVLIEDSDEVALRVSYYDLLRAQALSPRDSRRMISAALEELDAASDRQVAQE